MAICSQVMDDLERHSEFMDVYDISAVMDVILLGYRIYCERINERISNFHANWV